MMREPRSQVIWSFLLLAIRERGLCLRKYASNVADCYHAGVAVAERRVAFHVGTTIDAACKAEKANAKLIERYRSGELKLPADLEEALVEALPEPMRVECARALVRRYGFLPVRDVEPGEAACAGMLSRVADLAREFGEAMLPLSTVLADGQVDASDAVHLHEAMRQVSDLRCAVAGAEYQLRLAINNVCPGTTPLIRPAAVGRT